MKKKIIVALMAMTIAFSAVACTSANTADATSQEATVEATTEEATESADAASSMDSLEADLEEKSENSINEYFFSNISDEHIYDVTEFLYEDIDSVSVNVSMVSSFTNGNVYSITIDYEDCPGRYDWGTIDRFDLGLFYVTAEEIYMVYPSVDDISSEEEFLSKGVLVCSTNDSDETVDGERRRIVNEGDSCTFYSSNTLTESGIYYSYTWTKGKGLSFYRSGYGAEGEPIEITLNIPGDSSNNVSDYDSAEMMEGDALSETELNQLQEYLNQPDNYGFTVSSYKTPDEIDMGWVFAFGAGIENCDYSQEALNAYLEADEEFDSVEYDVIALAGEDVRSLIKAKTGIDDYDVSKIDGYTYVEAYDILFCQVSDYYDKDVICYEGVKKDNLIQIVYKVGNQDNRRRITLVDTKNSENPYTYCSNRELWEENAETTTEVRNLDTDETVTCAIVKIPKGHMIEVIKDNEVTASAEARIRKVDVTQYEDIKEIAISDVNGDGIGDMIVVLSDSTDTIAVVCKGWENEWDGAGYIVGENAVTEWLSANVSDMTAENVVSYIKDHQEEFMSL